MARVQWPLLHERPIVEATLRIAALHAPLTRVLLADTGAGNAQDPVELLLSEQDCLACGGFVVRSVALGGAYAGVFNVYSVRVFVPGLNFHDQVRAVAVPTPPAGFDGIACFRFLNRFSYGNFGNPREFGLEL